MATGLGYNPYRDSAGKFSRPEDVGKKVEGDLQAAYDSGDSAQIEAIESYAMDKMPESTLGQSILEKRYGTAPMPKRSFGLTAHEKELRHKTVELAKRIVELRVDSGDVTFDDANPERAHRRLDESIEYAEGRGNTNLVTKLSSASVLPSGAFQRKSDKLRVNTDAVLRNNVTEKEIEEGRGEIQRSIQRKIDSGEISEGKYTYRDDSGTYSLTVTPGFDEDAFMALDERTQIAISSPKSSVSIELAREKLSPELLEEVTNKQQVMDFVMGKKPEIDGLPKPNTNLAGSDSEKIAESGLKNLSSYTQAVEKNFGSKAERGAKKTQDAEIIKSAVADRGQNTFVPGRAYANGVLLSTRTVLNRSELEDKLSPAQIRSITAVSLQPDEAKAKQLLSKDEYAAVFQRQKAALRVTPTRKKKS